MKPQDFKSFWKATFPESYPIGHELRGVYPSRWFRIHSLPESKRYAQTEEEYQIIFERQNEIIGDLIGDSKEVILLFSLYTDDLTSDNYTQINEFGQFSKVDQLALHEVRPTQYDVEIYLDIFVKETTWKANQRNDILKAIADDQIRMSIIYPEMNRIIHPYDGGMDLILESEQVRDEYKEKYRRWLSSHPKGL